MEKLLTTENPLQEKFKEIFLDHAAEYDNLDELVQAIYRGEFSCSAGCIGKLTYYYQTEALFRDNFNDCLEMIEEITQEIGIMPEYNANNFIWTAFDYMVNRWLYEIETLSQTEKGSNILAIC